MEKVKLPKEAVEALELMRAKGAPLNEIVERHFNKDHIQVNGYGNVQSLPIDTLIRALYIGYEVKQTPEDKVRELFVMAVEQEKKLAGHSSSTVDWWEGRRMAIIDTLNALGIKVVGVNP